jgi:hypothetical protein
LEVHQHCAVDRQRLFVPLQTAIDDGFLLQKILTET